MSKNDDQKSVVKELGKVLSEMMTELFGECIEQDGVLRARAGNMGVVNAQVIIEAVLEGGLREDAPYGVLHFHTTIAENIPQEALADLLISLNGINHVINAGAFPGFGCFCYYEPLDQVYLSYRMPVNLNEIESEYDNIRYYLACLYDEMDIFVDFIMFAIANPGGMTISEYMEYLDTVSDLDDLEERLNMLEREFNETFRQLGLEDENGNSDKKGV